MKVEREKKVIFTLENRINNYIFIKKYISDKYNKKNYYCIGKLWKNDYEIKPQVLGFGRNGVVYSGKLKDYELEVIIKEGILKDNQYEIFKKYKNIPETFLSDIITNEVIKNSFPHYNICYHKSLCDNLCFSIDKKILPFKLKGKPRNLSYSCFSMIMEKWDGNLKDLTSKWEFSEKLALNLLSQLILILYYTHNKLGIYHTSLRFDNILYKKIKPDGYWKYYYNNQELFLKNMGYIICLNDFGNSIIYKSNKVKNFSKIVDQEYFDSFNERIDCTITPPIKIKKDDLNTHIEYQKNKDNFELFPVVGFINENLTILKRFVTVFGLDTNLLIENTLKKDFKNNYNFNNKKIDKNKWEKDYINYIIHPQNMLPLLLQKKSRSKKIISYTIL